MQVLLSTTGTLSPVTIDDLGARSFTHPTVDFDITLEFTIDELMESEDLQSALSDGHITLKADGSSVVQVNDQLGTGLTVKQDGVEVLSGVNVLDFQGANVTGATGTATIFGFQGAQGNEGNQGYQGDTGTDGLQGLQGFGFQGVQGDIGYQGLQGNQGIIGPGNQGPVGPQGPPGGAQGFQGDSGTDGLQGFQGIQGPQSATRSLTDPVPMGEIYINNNATVTTVTNADTLTLVAPGWTLATSTDFDESSDGFLRYTGVVSGHAHMGTTICMSSAGSNQVMEAVLVKNATVNVNNEYVSGTILSAGTVEFKNAGSGDVNSAAIHVMTTLNQNDTVSLFIMNKTSAADFTVVEANMFAMIPFGQQGFQGLQGLQGFQGNIGTDGVQGFQGIIGAGFQGNEGPQGFQASGFQGFQGIIGAGFQGNEGPQGFQASGFQGFQGIIGAGFQGNEGPQGFQASGFQGFQGIIGAGFQGYQGFQASGFQGNQGAIGAGFQGYQGFQASGFQGYQGNTGAGFQGYQGLQGASPDEAQVLYVSTTGDDATGDGSLGKPYKTIKAANDSITDNSSSNQYVVCVFPGAYTEDAIAMKNYVDIRAVGGPYTTSVTASAVGNTMFTSTGNNTLAGFSLTGATSGKAYLVATTSASGIIKDCVIYNVATGVECTTGSIICINIATAPVGSVTNLIYGNGGEIRGNGLAVASTSTITNVVHGTGSNTSIVYTGLDISGTNVTTGVRSDAGAEVRVMSGAISNATNGVYILGTSSELKVIALEIDNCTNGMRADGTGSIHMLACEITNSGTLDFLVESTTVKVHLTGLNADFGSASFPTGYANEIVFINDETEDDEGFKISGELAVGRPERGSESIFGEGDSYTAGMVVLTTDSTATSTTDGGNLTDESADAASASGSTFTFQGTAANHTILIGSNRFDASDALKHWGIKVKQTTAAVEVTAKSFTFEYWDGTNWTEFSVMASQSGNFDSYGNVVFIRANSSEHIRFGLTEDITGIDWARKTIDGKNLYWTRIRINTAVTTAPVFEQFKLHSSRFEANSTGTNTYHGRSRFRVSLTAAGNVFGEEGGILDVNLAVGSGGSPTGWTHNILNSELGGNGDAVHYQYTLPKGLDTSLPLYLDVLLAPEITATSQAISMIASIKPAEVQGVWVADPAGGTSLVQRTLANTDLVTNAAALTDTVAVQDTTVGKPFLLEFGPFDVSDYYPGDLVFLRVEMDDDGSSNNDLYVMEVALTGVNWKHGDAL